MALVKLVTTKRNRFDQKMNISGVEVKVDSKGIAEVAEKDVFKLLLVSFELVNPKQKFQTEDQTKLAEEMELALSGAKTQAEKIISDAKIEAEKIISDATEKAATIISESKVEEKEILRVTLEGLTEDQLKEQLATSKVSPDDYKDLDKAGLIDLTLKLAFS